MDHHNLCTPFDFVAKMTKKAKASKKVVEAKQPAVDPAQASRAKMGQG